jgi:hypothetical protein
LQRDNRQRIVYVSVEHLDVHMATGLPPARGEGGKRVCRASLTDDVTAQRNQSLQQDHQLKMWTGLQLEQSLEALARSAWLDAFFRRCIRREALLGWKRGIRDYRTGLMCVLDGEVNVQSTNSMRNGRHMLRQRLFEGIEDALTESTPPALHSLVRETRVALNREEARILAERSRLVKERPPQWSRLKKNLGEQLKTLKWTIIREQFAEVVIKNEQILRWCLTGDTDVKRLVLLCAIIKKTALVPSFA